MKNLLRSLILVIGLAACSSGPAERPETEHFRQVLLRLSWENKRILGRTDPEICGFALEQDHSSKYETPRWEDDSTFRKYVDEAKRRGFSAHSCAALFGWTSTQASPCGEWFARADGGIFMLTHEESEPLSLTPASFQGGAFLL